MDGLMKGYLYGYNRGKWSDNPNLQLVRAHFVYTSSIMIGAFVCTIVGCMHFIYVVLGG